MKQKILTFNNFDDVEFQEHEFVLPDGYKKLQVNYSTISPGTELFCIHDAIQSGSQIQPGYIITGTDESGQKYFLFPSLAESSACHCNVRAVGPKSLLLPIPPDISLEEAGFLRFINIGLHAFNQLPKMPKKVCVIGLGVVGNLAAQAGRLLGCDVIGVDPCENRRKIAEQCGIASVITPEKLNEHHRTYDLVIDTVAAASTLKTTTKILCDGGECSIIGIIKDGELKATEILREIWQRKLVFRSGWEMLNPIKNKPESIAVSTEENLIWAINWLENGGFCLKPLLTGIIPAEITEIKKAYSLLKDYPDENMCYVIKWQ